MKNKSKVVVILVKYVRNIRFASFTKQKQKTMQSSNCTLKINQAIEIKT